MLSEHYGLGGEQRHETGTSTDIQDNGESCVKRQVFKNVSDDTIETRGNYNAMYNDVHICVYLLLVSLIKEPPHTNVDIMNVDIKCITLDGF